MAESRHGRSVHLSKGEKLIVEGDPPGDVFFLRNGILIAVKSNIIIGEIKAPALVGEASCLLSRPRSTSILSRTECDVEAYHADTFLGSLTTQNDIGVQSLEGLEKRYRMTRTRIDEYQYLILREYISILAELVVSKKFIKYNVNTRSDILRMQQEYTAKYADMMFHKNAAHDYDFMDDIALQEGVRDKFHKKTAENYRSFRPMDTHRFPDHRLEKYVSFMQAAKTIAEDTTVLTRYLADFQLLNIGHIEAESLIIDQFFPRAQREPVLIDLMRQSKTATDPATYQKKLAAHEQEMKSKGITDPDSMPLFPIARQMGIDRVYMQILWKKWEEFLRQEKKDPETSGPK